jgi:predicted alpha/beta superfamily hydrolase
LADFAPWREIADTMSADFAQPVAPIARRGCRLVCLATVGGLLAFAACGAPAGQNPAASVVFQDSGPVVASRERQFDFVSRINGQSYRLMISAPLPSDRGGPYPVLYVLDGNWYFRAASDTATWGSGSMPPAIVVGIGYPTEGHAEVRRRRTFDLTLPAPAHGGPPGQYGGGDAFLRVVEEEVKPFVAARYKVDPARQAIYGKSYGGLMVLRLMFRNPTSFGTYIAASPAIWFNDRAVLADEKTFSDRARAGRLHLKLLLTSGGDEQYRGTDPKLVAMSQAFQMIDNASELAARLAVLDPKNVQVVRAIFPGESHDSVSLVSLGRAVRFALEPPPVN